MRGRKPRDLALGAEDAAALRQVARCQSLPWFQVRRARTVLGPSLAANGSMQSPIGWNATAPRSGAPADSMKDEDWTG